MKKVLYNSSTCITTWAVRLLRIRSLLKGAVSLDVWFLTFRRIFTPSLPPPKFALPLDTKALRSYNVAYFLHIFQMFII